MFSNIPPNPPRWKPADPLSINIHGLDKDASTIDQIEQIEQLITIKLQNIDENFSKIHNVLANKLLPAVKRYSLGTEPVRESAKFWTSFYEQAAQIRIPTYEEFSTTHETEAESEDTAEATAQHQPDQTVNDETIHEHRDIFEPSVMNSETSFLPAQAAISSTPATTRLGAHQSYASDDPSWTASMESPLVRLNREITQLSVQQDDSIITSSPAGDLSEFTIQRDMRSFTADKGKAKEGGQPLLRNVLKHNLYSTNDTASFDLSAANKVSPLKFRAKPKTPVIDRSRNPYLNDDTNPSEWSGLVDLRDPAALTPQRIKPSRGKHITPSRIDDDDDDDSFDGLPPGMSPPVLMSPARPPRSSAELGLLKLGQTPMKEASSRIQRDLLRDAQLRSGQSYAESTMSTLPTPPSLSRYRLQDEPSTSSSVSKDSSLESMIRHIRRDIRSGVGSTPGLSNTPGLRLRPRAAQPSSAQAEIAQPVFANQAPSSEYNLATPHYDDLGSHQEDLDSDSDSMDEINTTAHPSAAFLMASQGAPIYDDSFGSSNHSSDSMTDEDVDPGIVPIHPFAGNNAVEDDGFDDDDDFSADGFELAAGPLSAGDFEETLFGVAPAQGRASEGGQLRMLGEDLLQDTIGIGAQIAAHGRVEESPTPASWAR